MRANGARKVALKERSPFEHKVGRVVHTVSADCNGRAQVRGIDARHSIQTKKDEQKKNYHPGQLTHVVRKR